MRILYIVSLFPCWSETFIVREIMGMIRLGVDVRIVSLKHPSEKLVQSDAAALLDRVSYPASWWRTALSAITTLLFHPVREIGDLIRIFRSLRSHSGALAKTMVVWWRTLGLLPVVRTLAPTHIHAHWATYPSTAAWLLSKRIGIPFSFTAHAHDIFLEDHLLADKMPAAKATIAISKFNRTYLQEHVAGADRCRIEIVHCGVSPDGFPFVPDGRDRQRILAVGRLDDIKGFPHLIDACARLRDNGVAFRCHIIGSGPLEDSLTAQIKRLGLQERVHLLGVRKQEEVRAALYQAGVFALPSVVTSRGDRDGIPVALMEAMATGIPVVSTRVSGIPELVEDDVTGLVATPGDADDLARCLTRLLNDAELGARLAVKARERVEQEFDIQKEVRKLHDVIAGH
jgi:colanic acid/amylovoran biosynthesis glycosyltransferase